MKTHLTVAHISDTHTKHWELTEQILSLQVDVLMSTGDGSNARQPIENEPELRDFLTWMSSFDHIPWKLFIPGNHDTSLFAKRIKPEEFPNIIFLIDKEQIIEGVKFYGSPWTPTFGRDWAWNCNRGKIAKHWKKIPEDTRVLGTHGPPHGMLDLTAAGYGNTFEQVGCKDLRNRIWNLPKLEYNCFGHIHDESNVYNYGMKTVNNVNFINGSICDLSYEVRNKPFVFNVKL